MKSHRSICLHEVRVIENCWIPMPDGCRLAARIWLPADAEISPVPAILEYIPYRKRDFHARTRRTRCTTISQVMDTPRCAWISEAPAIPTASCWMNI